MSTVFPQCVGVVVAKPDANTTNPSHERISKWFDRTISNSPLGMTTRSTGSIGISGGDCIYSPRLMD